MSWLVHVPHWVWPAGGFALYVFCAMVTRAVFWRGIEDYNTRCKQSSEKFNAGDHQTVSLMAGVLWPVAWLWLLGDVVGEYVYCRWVREEPATDKPADKPPAPPSPYDKS